VNGTIVLLGDLRARALDRVAKDFGWSLESVDGLSRLRDLDKDGRVIAVLFNAPSLDLSWGAALELVRDAAPSALPIVCHHFSDEIDWPSLAEQGAFHALPLPLSDSEVRQSFGFIWSARRSRIVKAHAAALVA